MVRIYSAQFLFHTIMNTCIYICVHLEIVSCNESYPPVKVQYSYIHVYVTGGSA